jgi:hypothetical protein
MRESRRRAYLDAMGFDVWSVKPPEPVLDRLLVRPGKGSLLLICDAPESTATRFAGDIARAFAGEVVWAWPDLEGNLENPTLEQAISDGLFTRVVFFGPALGRQVLKRDVPDVIGSASLTISEDLGELAVRGDAKKALWKCLSPEGTA